MVFDLKTAHWTQPEVRGQIPKGRARHASVIYEDKLFIIGGVTGEASHILDDIAYLDLKTWTWSRTWSFVTRFDHTSWIWGGRLWVFGGMGNDMERSTEIWWLDLKGSPSFGLGPAHGSLDSHPTFGRVTPGFTNTSVQAPTMSVPGAYAANSGSVQIRPSRKEKPTAPGAISSLKFLSGPHVPTQSSGMHFHAYSSGTLLDLVSPVGSFRSVECNLSSLELDSLRWQRLVEGPELFPPGYRWHYCTINADGTKAWLLGSPIDEATGIGPHPDAHLSEILTIDLKRYGMLGNDLLYGRNSEQNRILASERDSPGLSSGLGADLAAMFDQSPEAGSMTDFTITALKDDGDVEDGGKTPMSFTKDDQQPNFLASDAPTSEPIHVHKIILQARWPHFKRMYAAKMSEFHTKRLHIPEPYTVVRAFLYYLYTDSIAPHPQYCTSLTDVAGMLVMANLYDMPKLRLLCVHRLSRELDVEHAAIIWERAGRTNEEWLKRRAATFCLTHWGRIVRTIGFLTLNKESLVELCAVVDTDGRVVGGDELEMIGGLGGAKFGSSGQNKRPRLGTGASQTADEVDDAEEEDGMELN